MVLSNNSTCFANKFRSISLESSSRFISVESSSRFISYIDQFQQSDIFEMIVLVILLTTLEITNMKDDNR